MAFGLTIVQIFPPFSEFNVVLQFERNNTALLYETLMMVHSVNMV